jgi:hypothetical protein
MSLMALNRPTLTADKEVGQWQHTEQTWILSRSRIVEGRMSEGSRSSSDGRCLVNDDVSSQCEDNCKAVADLPTEYNNGCWKFDSRCLDSLNVCRERQKADSCNDDACITHGGSTSYENKNVTDASLCLVMNYVITDSATMQQKPVSRMNTADSRMITPDELRAKVCENNLLSSEQHKELYDVLIKYQHNLTKRPGRCTNFQYEFKIEGKMPASSNSRPIPFALREQVQKQIQAMVDDGLLEASFSEYINPLTLVLCEGKQVQICVDARRVNKQIVSDRTKVLPMRELLQRFHGSSYKS